MIFSCSRLLLSLDERLGEAVNSNEKRKLRSGNLLLRSPLVRTARDCPGCFGSGSLHLRGPRDKAVQSCPLWNTRILDGINGEASFRNDNVYLDAVDVVDVDSRIREKLG